MAIFYTIAQPVDTELVIQRSRFLTLLAPATTEAQAREVIAQVKAAHPRARHHCTAFVLGADGRTARHNDDGEPSGTAGMPMLEALQQAQLTDVVAVVTRYFGGVLLGAAGLTRAYRAAVAEAVAYAQILQRVLHQELIIECDYQTHAPLLSQLRLLPAQIGQAEFGAQVLQRIWIEPALQERAQQLIAQLSAGRAMVTLGETAYLATGW